MKYADTAWKNILDSYLPQFFDLCLPVLHRKINWDKSWVSLDKELNAITKDNLNGTKTLDKLIKVFLLSGQEQWILIHIEIQGQKEISFPERMYLYATRAVDRYRRPIFSCAVLTDANPKWKPTYYELAVENSRLRFDFAVIKLLDYQAQKKILEESNNPFASVILTQLALLECKNKTSLKLYDLKFSLTKRLLHKNKYTHKQIKDLYTFLDWLIRLPKALEYQHLKEIRQYEEAHQMTYISNAERIGMQIGMRKGIEQGIEQGMEQGMEQGIEQGIKQGIKQGIEQGIKQGMKQGMKQGETMLLTHQLIRRFGSVSKNIHEQMAQANQEQLLKWAEKILDARSLEEVFE